MIQVNNFILWHTEIIWFIIQKPAFFFIMGFSAVPPLTICLQRFASAPASCRYDSNMQQQQQQHEFSYTTNQPKTQSLGLHAISFRTFLDTTVNIQLKIQHLNGVWICTSVSKMSVWSRKESYKNLPLLQNSLIVNVVKHLTRNRQFVTLSINLINYAVSEMKTWHHLIKSEDFTD